VLADFNISFTVAFKADLLIKHAVLTRVKPDLTISNPVGSSWTCCNNATKLTQETKAHD